MNDYVHLSNFEWGGEIYIKTWVNYNTLKYARIIDFGNGSEADNILLGSASNPHNELWFHIRRGSSNQGTNASNSLYSGNWLHLVGTINNQNQAVIYRNGVVIKTGSTWTPSTLIRTKQYVGKSNWDEEYLHALLDDLRIYDRALSMKVQALYNLGNRTGVPSVTLSFLLTSSWAF